MLPFLQIDREHLRGRSGVDRGQCARDCRGTWRLRNHRGRRYGPAPPLHRGSRARGAPRLLHPGREAADGDHADGVRAHRQRPPRRVAGLGVERVADVRALRARVEQVQGGVIDVRVN